MMRRRELIAGLGSAAVWPIVVRAQQGDSVRRIGVLMFFAADDPESQARLTAFRQALQELGWTDGRNVLIEYRWSAADVDRARKEAAELIALAPDVILANASVAVITLKHWMATAPNYLLSNNMAGVPAATVDKLQEG
jgi:putative ABC transport system substrate-binding protein